ncbi:hypothetical protein [Pseudomonas sp. ICMP 561]|uniref:hypothetical protein n=1 Tax=Pseudomonas sp. ICMP 561 TaxID=1718918 RepID=UPI000C06C8B2|nr:hypothetical protein [Pseudomonas sp. ICMP 561]PHN28950.1 hypothetical protein AO242_26055 [Pseudomonas sp. ICMP 561]
MSTTYELLLERLSSFNLEKDRYWDNLATMVAKLPQSYRLFLGLSEPGWQNPDGSVHSYVQLGIGIGDAFVGQRAQLLSGTDEATLPFTLKLTLNPETPTQSSEELFFSISAKEGPNAYVFFVNGLEKPVQVGLSEGDSGQFDPLWSALTELGYRWFDPEIFTN